MRVFGIVYAVVIVALAALPCQASSVQQIATENPQASGLQLNCGTLQAGGVITVKTEIVVPDKGDSGTGVRASLEPKLGYFVMDHLEILGGLDFGTGFGELYAKSNISVGFNLGAQYIFGSGPFIYPYAGASFGMLFELNEVEKDNEGIQISVPAGLLLALNSHVAVDLGLRFRFTRWLEIDHNSYFEIPVGYFGVQAFF